jgi:hypothetical protein
MDYITSLNKNRVLKNGVYGYYEPYRMVNGLDNSFVELEPKRKRFDFSNENNWDIKFVYPFTKDKTHHLVNGGIKINSIKSIQLGNLSYYLIETSVKHNINILDNATVKIIDGVLTHTCKIFGLGDENGFDSEYKFIVIRNRININVHSQNLRFIRVVNNKDSEYYVRVFKEIPNTNNKYVDVLGLSKGVNKDNNYQMILEDTLSVNSLPKDVNGLPIKDIYLHIEKKTDGLFFTKINKGFKVFGNVGDNNISNISKIHNRNDIKVSDVDLGNPLEGFYGDICEFNLNEFKETVISEVYHRFNTINREYTIDRGNTNGKIKYSTMKSSNVYNNVGNEIIRENVVINYDYTPEHNTYLRYGFTNGFKLTTLKNGVFRYENPTNIRLDSYYLKQISDLKLDGNELPSLTNEPRLEGYIYKCLYTIPIMQFTDDIYTGGVGVNKPNYAKEIEVGSGIYVWRNIKKRSEDNLHIPIKNGSLYSFTKIKFKIGRQDKEGLFGLNNLSDLTNVNVDYVKLEPMVQNNTNTLC